MSALCINPVTVSTTATKLICCNRYGYRREVTLQNVGSSTVYISHSCDVSCTLYSYKLEAGKELQVFDNCEFFGVVATGTGQVAVLSSKSYY